jgi:hypothetical protein
VGAIAISLVAATVLVAFISFRHDVSPHQCARLEQLKNISIAHLENGRHKEKRGAGQGSLAKADAGFAELAAALPGDPLGARNLAITRLIELQEKSIEPSRAIEAAEMAIKLESDSAAVHLVAGQIALAADDKARAISELSRAAELAPADASIWFAISRLWADSQDESDQKRGNEALGRAYQAAPDNLFLLAAWATAQARQQDPQAIQTLSALRQTLVSQPALAESVSKRGRLPDPLAVIDEAAAAVEQNQWPAAQGRIRGLANVLKADTWSLNDLRRVDRDPLEYLLHDFREPCPAAGDGGETPAIEVKFNEFAAPQQLPPLIGVADIELADFNLDGELDVFLLRESAVEVYSRGGGKEWRPVATAALPVKCARFLLADLDQDDPEQPGSAAYARRQAAGKASANTTAQAAAEGEVATPKICHRTNLDIAAYGPEGVVLVRNEFDPEKEIRTLQIEPHDKLAALKTALAARAVDFDHDGDLDLAISTSAGFSLWANHGEMAFVDASAQSQLPPAELQAKSIVPIDWDGDVDFDLVLCGASDQAAGYLENLRHGQFRWRAFTGDFAALKGADALTAFDAGAPRGWALAAAGASGLAVVRTELGRQAEPTQRSQTTLVESPRAGVRNWDFDNDGRQDLLSWSDKGIDVYRGAGGGQFETTSQILARGAQPVLTCRTGDLDGDGDLDLAVAETDRVVLYKNEGGDQNHWLNLELVAGLSDQQNLHFRVNHYGVGSLVEVRSGPLYQRQIVDGATAHFGLGRVERPDLVRIVWTNGIPQDVVEPEANQSICEAQILGGSCPYLYTWTGEKFEFFTDCLWAAPLGLQFAEGVLSPSRAWEYLHIDGARLKPRDGEYVMQLTEELWEATYLDEVQLLAVDHPDDVSVFSNEKVGPAEIAEFKIHTVRQPRVPRAARDQSGRDVLGAIAACDGEYLKPFDRKIGAGYAEPHYLELDLGDLADPNRITLFLTGWIFPASTSMNVGVSQNAALTPRQAPSLWVPDAGGQWRQVRPFIGFPGGKTKTIAIDLSGIFSTADYRLRIATNLEIYWDQAFFTVDEEPAPVATQRLKLTGAELHYRGFSHRSTGERFGPDRYDYGRTSREPKWPAMSGYFTRFGPVETLLQESDDRLVIFGAGDELTLRFGVPLDEPPPGWKRDFLLYNVGWDKDADLNTVYGQTVEPLPFGAMSGYPYSAAEAYPADERHLEYLRVYQTRTQDPVEFWRRLSGPSPPLK